MFNVQAMRLSTRLTLAFGVVVSLSVLCSGFALMKLSEIEGRLSDVVTVNNVKSALLNDMSESVHVVSRVQRTLALLDDDARAAQEAGKIDAARAGYDKARQAMEQFPPSEAARAMRAAIDAAAAKARPLNDRALAHARKKERAEATALLLGEAGAATLAWQEALDANIHAQTATNAAEYKAAQHAYEAARNTLVGLTLVSLLVAAGLATLMVRSITRQLGGEPGEVARVAGAIADAFFVPLNLVLFWYRHREPEIPPLPGLLGYLAIAFTGSIGTALYLAYHRDKLRPG